MKINEIIADHYGPMTAKTYDQIARNFFWAYDESLKAAAFEIFFGRREDVNKVPAIHSLLDIGIGTGNLSEKIIELYTQLVPADSIKLDVVGFDFSSHMIDVAISKLEKFKNVMMESFIGKIEETESLLLGKKFDCIVSSYSIHHLNDAAKAALINALYELLNEGGKLIVVDRMPPGKNEKEQERDYYRVISTAFMDFAGGDQEEKPELSDVVEALLEQFKEDGDRPSTIEEHLQWFIDSGFKGVRTPFHSFGCAVVSGIKPKQNQEIRQD